MGDCTRKAELFTPNLSNTYLQPIMVSNFTIYGIENINYYLGHILRIVLY